ncbi:SAP domain-containing protein [Staphylococcus lloydii]|uniref:SAP domain-containing protein n=1 Tax=Staphylococcus lloydii TaxID=2781774 RepID=UPI002927FC6C|nr:SAP domain-containing protein [Staphylococcus lloydii]MDU9418926.1 SAP domain-containing protein [Staphylococcus lloydii]
MNLNVQDLLVLHENVNRNVGDERLNNFYLSKNNVDILSSLSKLIEEQILIKDNSLEVTLNKLIIKDLKTILKNGELTVGGTKKDLIERILNNIERIDDEYLELTPVYTPTAMGEKLLEETKYVVHFEWGYNNISLPQAHEIATNQIGDTHLDKVVEIYKFEINRIYKSTPIDNKLITLYRGLSEYFKRYKNDNDSARMYYNLAYYLQIKITLENMESPMSSAYDVYGKFSEERFKSNLEPIHFREAIYEQLIFIEGLSNEHIYDLFTQDVSHYYDLDKKIFKYVIDYLIAYLKKEDDKEAFSKIIDLIKSEYLIPKKERDAFKYYLDEDYYREENAHRNRQTIKTNINKLIKEDVNIEVEIDIDTGEIVWYIEEDELKKL